MSRWPFGTGRTAFENIPEADNGANKDADCTRCGSQGHSWSACYRKTTKEDSPLTPPPQSENSTGNAAAGTKRKRSIKAPSSNEPAPQDTLTTAAVSKAPIFKIDETDDEDTESAF